MAACFARCVMHCTLHRPSFRRCPLSSSSSSCRRRVVVVVVVLSFCRVVVSCGVASRRVEPSVSCRVTSRRAVSCRVWRSLCGVQVNLASLCRAVPCRAVPRRAAPCRAVLCRVSVQYCVAWRCVTSSSLHRGDGEPEQTQPSMRMHVGNVVLCRLLAWLCIEERMSIELYSRIGENERCADAGAGACVVPRWRVP